MRVLVFGASITQGFWDTEGGWVQRLRKHYDGLSLQNLRSEEDYPDVFNLGISGNKSGDLLERFQNEASVRIGKRKNAAIIFSIGTNNAYVTGQDEWPGTGDYEEDLEQVISQAQPFTSKILFVGLPPCEEEKTTPVFWRDIYYTNERILAVDKAAREVMKRHSLTHVETFGPMKSRMDAGEQLFADGLHPNNAGHQLMFELVRPELDKLLNK